MRGKRRPTLATINPSKRTPSNSRGIVYLVGGGPGDPGAHNRARSSRFKLESAADVVVYDALANPRLLSHCRKDAEIIYAGKQAAAHSMTQEAINALRVEMGLASKRVVRLKGGDPFLFGRGGEAGEALAAAGVRFEVGPGITAAIAAPAYAGIPVTHRDFNSSFTLLTGHERDENYQDPQAAARRRGRRGGVESGFFCLGKVAVPGALHGRQIAAANLRESYRPRHGPANACRDDQPGDQPSAADHRRDARRSAGENRRGGTHAAAALTIIGKVVTHARSAGVV